MKHGHRFLIGALVTVALAAALALIASGWQGAQAQGGTIYVDADATGANNGTSWEDAYTDLQTALDAALAHREIWVAAGTYTPTWEFSPGDPRSATFQLKNEVAIYGGFDPGAGAFRFKDRDWMTYVTILSGDIGIAGDRSDNSYHVFYHPTGTDLDVSAILDGFTIRGGNANGGAWPHWDGGGMYNDASSPVLTNCTFEGNSSTYGGGGMSNWVSSSPMLINCSFEGNWSDASGGGMFNDGSSPVLINCTFSGNWAEDSGGGMLNTWDSPAELINCTFEGNSANQNGGGMFNYTSSPSLTDCSFADNSAYQGGGMWNGYYSSPTLTDVTFSGNSADTGGGMHNRNSSSPILTSCTFHGNSAGTSGGGMYNSGSSPELTNCAFEGNSAVEYAGGGMHNVESSPILIDCTFGGNSAGNAGGGMANAGSSPVLTNCTFQSNSAFGGGGMVNFSSSPVLTNCTFSGNVGSGMRNSQSSPVLTDCTFTGNTDDYWGGGMSNTFSSSPVLTNCSFEGNSAGISGGGMYNQDDSSPALTNCTFSGNSSGNSGGAIFNRRQSSPVLANCILWGDFPEEIVNDDPESSPVVTFSDIQGGCDALPGADCGTGNIEADPLFVDPGNGDFHLGPDSPCIDAGSNEASYLPEYDFDGDPRILDGNGDGTATVDMGVDEFVISGLPVVQVEIDIKPGGDINSINLSSGGMLPVAILTTGEFDAGTVKPASVLLAWAAPVGWAMVDVDRDGDLDLLLDFKIQELKLDESSTEAILTGETFNRFGGMLIQGTDTVRIIP